MWGLISFLFGLLYGWMSPGRQSKSRLLWNGLWIGLIIALVLLVIGVATGEPALGFGGSVAMFVTILVLTLLFILGAWIGDLIETGMNRRRSGRTV